MAVRIRTSEWISGCLISLTATDYASRRKATEVAAYTIHPPSIPKMSSIKSVALAGGSGIIGTAVLKALTEAGFMVTVLTRKYNSHTFPPSVKIAEIDYNDAETLAAALQGQDAVVSAVGYAAIKAQEVLFDAAIKRGVQRVIPSEYGGDPDCAAVRQLPVFAQKVEVESKLKQQIQGTSTTYTLVCNNEFFDWDLDHKFGVDLQAKKMEVFDRGDVPFTATPLEFVAKGVVGVLQHPSETANRVVRLHGKKMTQNRLLQVIQHCGSVDGWEISHASTADREREGYEVLQKQPNNFMGWAIPFLQCAIWGRKFGGDFSQNNDNELLGLKELDDDEIKEIVRSRL
ncbi:uncharacterized protein LTR77_005886 [Saxophila tyrrhenica]|uniref:NmrA-like domain-containing protein n=1 Tax=Saxophila tyrrhenica TaxID=1690608 RepID=A0AAV9PAJ7_9PEZI|nr:hypothetical protein LTR77_005886 [Saxophila tyrrhenica]